MVLSSTERRPSYSMVHRQICCSFQRGRVVINVINLGFIYFWLMQKAPVSIGLIIVRLMVIGLLISVLTRYKLHRLISWATKIRAGISLMRRATMAFHFFAQKRSG